MTATVSAQTVLRTVELRLNELHSHAIKEACHALLFDVQRHLSDAILALASTGSDLPHHTTGDPAGDRSHQRTVQEVADLADQQLHHLGRLVRLLAVALGVQAGEGPDELVGARLHVGQAANSDLGQRLLQVTDEYQQVLAGLLGEVR